MRPVSNSYNLVPVRDVPRPPGMPCPLASAEPAPIDRGERARTLYLRLRDRMRLVRTATGDFSDDEILRIKETLGQIYADVSTKLAPDDFARDLRKLVPCAECAACARRAACPGAWEAAPGDVFTRDDARVRAILASLTGRVLDVGGGEAAYLTALAEHARSGVVEYVCVDPDEGRLAVLASRHPFARFVQGTAEELGADLGLFDHVLFLRSVNHLTDPARAFSRALRVLKPGGTLLLADNVAFGLVRTAPHAARAERAPGNALEHHGNHGSAEVAAILAATPAGRALRLLERRDIGPDTSNQWLLRYEHEQA